MKISDVAAILDAKVLVEGNMDTEVKTACGSDMMSDVLAFVKDQTALLTGLVNPQVIRTAMMVDMRCIVFVRGKHPTPEMIALAEENRIVLLSTGLRMYEACGRLYVSHLAKEG